MREQLIQYVNLLFAGAPDSEEIKLEILQNTLDRYDDLVSQGKSPEAAYRLAISGIGDINEILGHSARTYTQQSRYQAPAAQEKQEDTPENKQKRAVAVAMYILCPVPLFILGDLGYDSIGLCLTLLLVAAATALMIIAKKPAERAKDNGSEYVTYQSDPKRELRKSVGGVIWAIGLAVYFILSFATKAWYITWVIFPIIGSVQGLVNAIMDLKEANRYEN